MTVTADALLLLGLGFGYFNSVHSFGFKKCLILARDQHFFLKARFKYLKLRVFQALSKLSLRPSWCESSHRQCVNGQAAFQ